MAKYKKDFEPRWSNLDKKKNGVVATTVVSFEDPNVYFKANLISQRFNFKIEITTHPHTTSFEGETESAVKQKFSEHIRELAKNEVVLDIQRALKFLKYHIEYGFASDRELAKKTIAKIDDLKAEKLNLSKFQSIASIILKYVSTKDGIADFKEYGMDYKGCKQKISEIEKSYELLERLKR